MVRDERQLSPAVAANFSSENQVSAVMDGQPRHQLRPFSVASHRIIARRPSTPLQAHRAQHQRQLKARSSHKQARNAAVVRRTSAATDGQPRHQHRPPSLPHLHPKKYLRTDDHPDIIGGGHRPQFHNQEHLNKRRSGGIAPSQQLRTPVKRGVNGTQQHGRRDEEVNIMQSTFANIQEKSGNEQIFLAMQRLGRNEKGIQHAARTITEFKGCRRHSSKGDS